MGLSQPRWPLTPELQVLGGMFVGNFGKLRISVPLVLRLATPKQARRLTLRGQRVEVNLGDSVGYDLDLGEFLLARHDVDEAGVHLRQ
jgi:hypothetical protein